VSGHPIRAPIRARLETRAVAARRVREFFGSRGVTEVHSPVITPTGVTDVHLESVALRDGRFLRTSPEFAHKRLLAAGSGDLYELGPVFRAGEHGRFHREQFWLLEWYRVGWSWRKLAEEALALVGDLAPESIWKPRFISWVELMRETLNADPLDLDDGALAAHANDAPAGLDRSGLYDWLFTTRVQPTLPDRSVTIVFDYPACQAALARLRPGDPRWAERFELFVGSVEVGNGYRELTDPVEQRQRFEADNARRKALGLPRMPIDESLIHALEIGLPECSGIAIGFERLLMALQRLDSIDELAV